MIPWPQSQLAYRLRKQPMTWPPCTEKLTVAGSRTRLNDDDVALCDLDLHLMTPMKKKKKKEKKKKKKKEKNEKKKTILRMEENRGEFKIIRTEFIPNMHSLKNSNHHFLGL